MKREESLSLLANAVCAAPSPMGEGWGELSFSPPLRGGEVKGWVRSEEQKTGGQERRLNLEAKMQRCIEAKLLSIINFVTVLSK